jgi:hypothetical protein
MSYEDELREFMEQEGISNNPFKMVTFMPKRKVKITTYLEDSDGDRVELGDLAEDVLRFIEEQMLDEDGHNMVGNQLFPIINDFMSWVIPRTTNIVAAEFMMTAGAIRAAMSTYGMAVALLMQYVAQHNLKMVTEEEPLTQEEIDSYYERSEKAEQALYKALGGKNVPEIED